MDEGDLENFQDLGRPLKRLLNKAETGWSKPKSWRMMMMMIMIMVMMMTTTTTTTMMMMTSELKLA